MSGPFFYDDSNEIYCGDSLLILPELPDHYVDAVITDPPYSSGGMMRSDRMARTRTKYVQTESAKNTKIPEFSGDNRDQRSYGYWCTLWLAECLRIARPGAVCAVFSDWRQLPVTTDALQAAGWVWRGLVVWNKGPSARPQRGRFTAQSEFVIWGSKGPLEDDRGVGVLPGVLNHPPLYEGKDQKFHVAQKPEPVMRSIVSICTPGGTILDPFMGSGTTLRSAKDLGYRSIGIEVDRHSCEVAVDRLQQSVLEGMH